LTWLREPPCEEAAEGEAPAVEFAEIDEVAAAVEFPAEELARDIEFELVLLLEEEAEEVEVLLDQVEVGLLLELCDDELVLDEDDEGVQVDEEDDGLQVFDEEVDEEDQGRWLEDELGCCCG